MAKDRIEVPKDIAATLEFRSDRTCCICHERGRPIQIHHIDEDPSNNDINNLAVLCLLCHNETQIRGGFGRKLDAPQVIKYRDDWIARVQKRRDTADEIASAHQTPSVRDRIIEPTQRETLPDPAKTINYIQILPAIRRDIYSRSQQKWDTGVTSTMNQGCYDVIDVMEQLLVALADWYLPNHFDGLTPSDYMNAMTASRFTWHRAHLEPNGIGTGGTMIGTMVGGYVMEDLERMVVDIVSSLGMQIEDFEFDAWKQKWEAADG
jgi:hypothetical protein